ncbi:hypothetical protein DNK47_02735 [Mycoplasma wenyonii]|uniref:Uncharacterized protein n=1 Tax=Mycoplasma wenyonii TaxID=65123 RepID=A0A328PUT2_9MOLU|nr:hypothetical protein [Mycoplasma wenyonii]RAO94859.1 hypothetical protein DNK47_02735 [Mycoplasma wenyonii]
MSILSALPLAKIVGAGFAGMLVASPFVANHLNNPSEEPSEQTINGRPKCWLVMQGSVEKNDDQDKQLIVCKEDSAEENTNVKYYLRNKDDDSSKQEVESIEISDTNKVTITLLKTEVDSAPPESETKQETIRVSWIWHLGNKLNLNSDCKIEWEAENRYQHIRKLVCTPTRNKNEYKWLDPVWK